MKLLQMVMTSLLLVISLSSFAATFAEIQQQAEQGDALSQAKMGAMYQLGRNGVTKDEQQSAKWMLKAADQGLVEAQVFMAALYDRGLGVKHNVNTATKWYEKAAAQNTVPLWLFWVEMMLLKVALRLIINLCVSEHPNKFR